MQGVPDDVSWAPRDGPGKTRKGDEKDDNGNGDGLRMQPQRNPPPRFWTRSMIRVGTLNDLGAVSEPSGQAWKS